MNGGNILEEAASWYYNVAELYEDEDLDPQDHLKVVKRAFTSSDCDDFAAVLAEMTGWQPVRATWSLKKWGFGHHALVRSPEGRLLDVTGWVTESQLKKRYGAKEGFSILGQVPESLNFGGDVGDDGIDIIKKRIADVIRVLPHKPFNEPWMQEMTVKPVDGVDHPYEAEPGAGAPALG